MLQARVKFHVLLTTYEMVGFEAGTLRSLEYETLIVDEGHRLKNQQSKLFQQLHNFKTRQRTLLTGTPLQNNLLELWMLLHFLDAGKFQTLEQFQADFSDFSHGDQVHQVARRQALQAAVMSGISMGLSAFKLRMYICKAYQKKKKKAAKKRSLGTNVCVTMFSCAACSCQ